MRSIRIIGFSLAVALPIFVGCGGGGGGSQPSTGGGTTGTSLTVAQAISAAKGTTSSLADINRNVGTSFFPTQQVNMSNSLSGVTTDFSFYGRNFAWLVNSVHQLNTQGGTTLSGKFDTKTYFNSYINGISQWGNKTYPFTLTKNAGGFTYQIQGGAEGTWTGSVNSITYWPDGSFISATLVNSTFPGDMVWSYQQSGSNYTYGYLTVDFDNVNATLTGSATGSGEAQSVQGTIQRYKNGASSPSLTMTLTSATWTQYATGGPIANTPVWLPNHAAMQCTFGSYTFTGTVDFTNYQSNSTAAGAIQNGPSWGWQGLESDGTIFTNVHFVGKGVNTSGGEVDLDFTLGLSNYPALKLNQPLSDSNAPALTTNFSGKLIMPGSNPLTLVVSASSQGMYQVNSTLSFTSGSTTLSGTGTCFPLVTGQTSSYQFTAALTDQNGIQFVIREDMNGKFSGTVVYQTTTIGTISDVGLGPMVTFTDGTFQTLW